MDLFANHIKLPCSENIKLKFFNPLFNDIGSHSLPITFPNRLTNVNRAFGFANKEEIEPASYVPARIRTNTVDLIGSWGVKETSGGKLEAYFKGGIGDFYSIVKDRTLNTLYFGGYHYPAGVDARETDVLAEMTNKMNATYPEEEWVAFTAHMESPCDDSDKEVNPVAFIEGTGEPYFTTSDKLNSSVFLFAGTVIDYIFAEFGYRIEKNIFQSDPDLRKLVIFNNYNRRSANIGIFDYSKLVPQVSIVDFMKAIRNRFNIGFFIDETSKAVNIIAFNDIIAAGPSVTLTSGNLRIDKTRTEGLTFPHQAPDAWSSHTFTNVDEMFGDVKSVETLSRLNDLYGYAIAGHTYFVKSETNYYFTEDGVAVLRKGTDQFPYTVGTGKECIEQLSGIPGMYTEDLYGVGERVIPRCDLKSNREGYNYTAYPLMFLFAHGIQYCGRPTGAPEYYNKYPLGSPDVYDALGNKITGANIALRWHGSDGLIEKYWQSRIFWELNTKKIITTDFPGKVLQQLLNFSSIIRVGTSNYLINSVSAEFSNKSGKVTEAELFRL